VVIFVTLVGIVSVTGQWQAPDSIPAKA